MLVCGEASHCMMTCSISTMDACPGERAETFILLGNLIVMFYYNTLSTITGQDGIGPSQCNLGISII